MYTSQERGWPKETFTTGDLIRSLESRKYKWTYTDSKMTEEEVIRLIKNSDIELRGCWNVIEAGPFRKLRSGLVEERSPMKRREQRHRKLSHTK